MKPDHRIPTNGRSVRALDRSTWDAFDELCANSDGFPSGCYCIGFHQEGPTKHAGALNRARKHERVLAGTTHAALVFDGELCVGWCQFGPPEEVVRIKNRRRARCSSHSWTTASTRSGSLRAISERSPIERSLSSI